MGESHWLNAYEDWLQDVRLTGRTEEAEVFRAGFERGYEDGNEQGWSDGQEQGYEDGYAEGRQEAEEECCARC